MPVGRLVVAGGVEGAEGGGGAAEGAVDGAERYVPLDPE
jgi:hypothetical protein